MSDQVKKTLTTWAAVIGIIAGLSGLFGAWVVLPHRMAAAETEIREVKTQAKTDHDLLTRIDERTARMEKALDRLTK